MAKALSPAARRQANFTTGGPLRLLKSCTMKS
jgi:hypothetical protein